MGEPFNPYAIPCGWSVTQLIAARNESAKQELNASVNTKAEPMEQRTSRRLETVSKPIIMPESSEQIDFLSATSYSTVLVKSEPRRKHGPATSVPNASIKSELAQPVNLLTLTLRPNVVVKPKPLLAHESSTLDSKTDVKPALDLSLTDRTLASPSLAHVNTYGVKCSNPDQHSSQKPSRTQPRRNCKSKYSSYKPTVSPPLSQHKIQKCLSAHNYAFIGKQKPWSKCAINLLIARYGGKVRKLNKLNKLNKLKRVQELFSVTVIEGKRTKHENIPHLGDREVRIIDQKTLLHEIEMKTNDKKGMIQLLHAGEKLVKKAGEKPGKEAAEKLRKEADEERLGARRESRVASRSVGVRSIGRLLQKRKSVGS